MYVHAGQAIRDSLAPLPVRHVDRSLANAAPIRSPFSPTEKQQEDGFEPHWRTAHDMFIPKLLVLPLPDVDDGAVGAWQGHWT